MGRSRINSRWGGPAGLRCSHTEAQLIDGALLWCFGILAVFVPISVHRYRCAL